MYEKVRKIRILNFYKSSINIIVMRQNETRKANIYLFRHSFDLSKSNEKSISQINIRVFLKTENLKKSAV